MISANISLAWLLCAVVLSAAIACVVLSLISRGTRLTSNTEDTSSLNTTFLIKNGFLVDGPLEDTISEAHGQGMQSWADLRACLGNRFEDLGEDVPQLSTGDEHIFRARDTGDHATLTIKQTPQGQTLTLDDKSAMSAIDRHVMLAKQSRAFEMQNALDSAPAIVFAVGDDSSCTWGNAMFRCLKDDEQAAFLKAAGPGNDGASLHVDLCDPVTEQSAHYEMTRLHSADQNVYYAMEVTKLIEADTVRREFIQTLTKTFADLSTGLTVFDRDHRLVLFNPAILDLTELSPEFLIGKPHMMEFFDRLRDNHVMPEPKNYATWRSQIGDMISSAANGHYSESWSLPGGLTYKLTGRPHPNGAIAFLIEDITNEMTLTRQSRRQLETHQAILDAMHDAVAVIGPDGGLQICNASFVDVVGFDPDDTLTKTTLRDVMTACRTTFPNAPLWDELSSAGCMGQVETLVHDTTGAPVHLRIEPLRDGLLMLNLSAASPAVPLSA